MDVTVTAPESWAINETMAEYSPTIHAAAFKTFGDNICCKSILAVDWRAETWYEEVKMRKQRICGCRQVAHYNEIQWKRVRRDDCRTVPPTQSVSLGQG